MCAEREREYPWRKWADTPPRCAFRNGVFDQDNWNCATMNALRQRARELDTDFRVDDSAASIGYVPFEGDDFSGYIVMTWYKDRGATGNALIMWDDHEPRQLTEEIALVALDYSRYFMGKFK